MAKYGEGKPRTAVAHLDDHPFLIARQLDADPVGRGFKRVVECIEQGLFQHRVRNDQGIACNCVDIFQPGWGLAGAPINHHPVKEPYQRGAFSFLAARLPGRQKHPRHDLLAAAGCPLHLGDILGVFLVADEFGNTQPVVDRCRLKQRQIQMEPLMRDANNENLAGYRQPAQ